MDVCYDSDEIVKKCFKCDQPVLHNLNVIYNASNTTVILWNKFQILAFKNLELECASKIIVPEFQIQNIITSNNYLICVDYTGNIHTTSLKFKNAAQTRIKFNFQPREFGVMACSLFGEDHTISLKYEFDMYFLCVHKITTEFNLEKKVIIMCNEHLLLQQTKNKYILKSFMITERHIEYVKKVFNTEDMNMRSNPSLVFVSLDKISVYCCIFSTKMTEDEVTLVKLYTCPSEISDIDFITSDDNLNILIGLTIGTLVSLNLKEIKTPEIIHLNSAIHKFIAYKDTVLYTDGLSMWKVEQILSKEIKFSQLFVKNVKDFIKFGDQIICTTFSNITYTFSLDNERSYLKPQSIDEYCCAEKLFDNTQYLKKILEEVKKNDELIKKQIKERNYITALSLANRQDVMDNIIKKKVIVYENYEDATSENPDVMLTNNFSEYFDVDSFFFLIKLTTSAEHRLHDILSNSIGDLRVHITLISAGMIVKTTTVKLQDLIKNITVLIPLKNKYISTKEMRVDLKIVTNIPGALDAKQKIWTVLFRKSAILNSEHFIRFNFLPNKKVCLKETKESLEELILQTAMNLYGNLIKLSDTEQRPEVKRWHMYVRLPSQYHEVLKNEDTAKQFTSKKVNYFLRKFTSEDFLKSRCDLSLPIGKEKVIVEIDNDGFSTPSLKISSHNAKITLDIRNFLSDLIYHVFADFGPGKEFVNHSFYITVENLQKAIKECITSPSEEDILPLIEQFERKVLGLLPI